MSSLRLKPTRLHHRDVLRKPTSCPRHRAPLSDSQDRESVEGRPMSPPRISFHRRRWKFENDGSSLWRSCASGGNRAKRSFFQIAAFSSRVAASHFHPSDQLLRSPTASLPSRLSVLPSLALLLGRPLREIARRSSDTQEQPHSFQLCARASGAATGSSGYMRILTSTPVSTSMSTVRDLRPKR